MRQFVRHRTFRLNEWSGRYSELADEFFIPKIWRIQDTSNKQGSIANLQTEGIWNDIQTDRAIKATQFAYKTYQDMLKEGVAKEMARFVLPVAIYTEIYVNCDLHNLLHFLRLRQDGHAQSEIQDIANAMRKIAEQLFPWTFEAFSKYKFKLVENE